MLVMPVMRLAAGVAILIGAAALDAGRAGAQGESPPPRVSIAAQLVVPIEARGAAALGRGWNRSTRRFVSQRGACIEYRESSFEPGEQVHATLETLSRAGGHLRLGLHVAAHRGVESIEGARLVDAARRLALQDLAAFRAHCGDAFVAGTVTGAHFVGEFDIDTRNGNAAHRWLERRRLLGPTDDLEHLAESLVAFAGEFPLRAQVLPGGRRSSARPVSAEAMIAQAFAFPESPEASVARPYLGLLLDYPERLRSGLSIDLAMQAPSAPGRAVFAAMRLRRAAASEMHLAHPARRPAPPVAVRAPVFRVERLPVRVVQAGGVSVYAGAGAPPDHFVERAHGRSFWIPGAAAGTPRVRAAIQSASEAMARSPERWPLHWVRRYAAGDLRGAAVYLSPDAPIAGIHSGRNPEGYAWIPGVAAPSARQRKLVDDVLSAATAPVSSAP